MNILKRDGSIVPFEKNKIINAINCAFLEVDGVLYEDDTAKDIADEIYNYFMTLETIPTVENVQDMVEDALMVSERRDVAREYVRYRYKRELVRESNTTDQTIKEMLDGVNTYWNDENSNKNAKVVTTQRDYLAGITSTDIAKRFLLPKDVLEAHNQGIIHEHDMDYMAQNALHNCCLINLEDMLMNGTIINKVKIDPQHKLSTAATVATQIITAVASSQYGGTTISLTHLAPFVRMSYNKYYDKYKNRGFNSADCEKYAEQDLKIEIRDSVQTFNYQINSMSTTNGQAPFLSVYMYINETEEYQKELAMLIEEFLNQRILGMKNEKGVYVTPAFPKLLYVLDENNIYPDSKYYYLTELSAKCTAKRMVPDYISAKVMRELKKRPNGESQVYSCMGCRSFLTPDRTTENYAKALNYDKNKGKYYGRFNMGVTTINLVDAGLSANKNLEDFWKLLDERCELCHKGLQVRINRLEQVTSDVAPILWQDGALARLDKKESLHNLIHHGYSTASLGFAGLWECVLALNGKKLTEPEGEELGLKILQFLNDKCAKWKKEEDIDYSVYGTPIESTTYKFASNLQKRFGKIEGITDKNYITNSYHIHVTEPIDAFNKLAIEAKFQRLAPGGAISYIEVPNMTKNIPAVLDVIKFIYDNIMYAELNTKSDYCMKCGFDGEIVIKKNNDSNLLYWECPNCGNTDQSLMSVTRRTCGYLGSNYWNQGRTQEIAERELHL